MILEKTLQKNLKEKNTENKSTQRGPREVGRNTVQEIGIVYSVTLKKRYLKLYDAALIDT